MNQEQLSGIYEIVELMRQTINEWDKMIQNNKYNKAAALRIRKKIDEISKKRVEAKRQMIKFENNYRSIKK